MNKILAIVLLGFSSLLNAQTQQTTPNLITSGTNHTWTGVTTGSVPTGCATAGPCPGGPTPLYDPSTNTINFSYNANAYVGQTMAINQALAGVGAGVKIGGYNYSYDIRNMNGDNRQGGIDTITVAQVLRGANNSSLLSSNQYYNTKFEWQTVTGSKTAVNPINISDATYLQIGITGGDNGYWGGYFGPQVRNVNMSLNYTVDPCATNPAYSPTCANYNTVNVSNNLVPNPSGYAQYGYSINQSYAINQALNQSGAGVMIHGFQWGYVANANGPYCGSWDMWILGCWDYRTPSVSTNVNITDANGASLYSISRSYTNSYNTTNYQYVFPSSRNLSTLGNFNFTASTNDVAYVGDMWSKALYTPDPCTVNPLSSTSCPLYQQAFLEQQCSANPLYSTQCAGYATAYFNQQCSTNQLYNPSCPGYAAAYLTYQCSINPLYSTTCAGYETAYFNQQCSANALYNTRCSGYEQAYHTQQCSINPLYATTCDGYAGAYHNQQCSLNPLYATDCSGYQEAYFSQQCSISGLYNQRCPNYAEAYAKKMLLEQQKIASTVAVAGQVAAVAQADPAKTTTSTPTVETVSVSPAATATAIVPVAKTEPAATPVATISQPTTQEAPKPAAQQQEQKPTQPTARQQLTERRQAAARAEAVEKGKNLAKDMGKASDMESQKQVQNVVMQAMGFTPGFDAYNNALVPDAVGYKPFTVYNNQKTVDNRRLGMGLYGPSDRLHNDLVGSQYKGN